MTEQYLYIPLPGDYSAGIERLVRENDLFLVNGGSSSGTYVMSEYLTSDIEIQAHMDRNILSHIANLVRGSTPATGLKNPAMIRLAAACWAFWGVVNASFNATLGVYEYGSSLGHNKALAEYQTFRRAVEIEPRYFAAVAMGDLPPEDFAIFDSGIGKEQQMKEGEFEKKLNNWRGSYWTVLKIAELQRTSLSGEQKLMELIGWMTDEAVFNAVGLVLGAIGFSPQSLHGLLRGLRTKGREELRARMHNIAWDMTHIRGWSQACANCPSNEIHIFASLDKGLRHLARYCVRFDEPDGLVSEVDEIYKIHWGSRWQVVQGEALKREKAAWKEDRSSIVPARISGMDESIGALELGLGVRV